MKSHINTEATMSEAERIRAIQQNAENYFNNHLLVDEFGRSRSDDEEQFISNPEFVKEQEKVFGPMHKGPTGIMLPDGIENPNVRDAFLESIIANPDSIMSNGIITPEEREVQSWALDMFPPYDPNIEGQGKGMTEDEYICWCVDQMDQPVVKDGMLCTSPLEDKRMELKLNKDRELWENNPGDSSRFETENDPPYDFSEEDGLVNYSDLPKDTKQKIAMGDAGLHPDPRVLEAKKQNMLDTLEYVGRIDKMNQQEKDIKEDSFGLESTMFQPSASTARGFGNGYPQYAYNWQAANQYRTAYGNGYYGGYNNYYNPYFYQYNDYQKQQDDMRKLYCMTGNGFKIPQEIPWGCRRDFNRDQRSQFTKIEKDGNSYWIRTVSPYFSVKPDGNSYQTSFMSVYQYPDHPHYTTIKDLYEAEEFDYIRSNKRIASIGKSEETKNSEDFKSFLERVYNPYSFENAIPIPEPEQVQEEQPKKRGRIIQIGKRIIMTGGEKFKEWAEKTKQRIIERVNKAYQELYEYNQKLAGMARVVAETDFYFPELKTNCGIFDEGNDIMSRYMDHFIYEPERRARRFSEMYQKFDMNFWLSDKKEDILKKDAIWQRNMASIRQELGIVETEEDIKDREIDRQAYDIAFKYHVQELVPNKPTFKIPIYELEKLPKEVLIRLGFGKMVTT